MTKPQLPKQRRSHQLVRRHVGKLLGEYYAQPANKVVGHTTLEDHSPSKQNHLQGLMGEWHWRRYLKQLYDTKEGHWLTPVELFQPYYSNIIGNYCIYSYESYINDNRTKNNESVDNNVAASVTDSTSLDIVELGGGRGTNADQILSHLKETKPDIYEQTSYTIVDSSPSLHRLQQDLLLNGEHASKVDFALKDLMDVAEGKVELFDRSTTPTVVIGCEVLDNLPHDKMIARSRKKLQQAEVSTVDDGEEPKETFTTLSDPLLSNVLKKVPSYTTSNPYNCPVWIPTVACGILQHIAKQRPVHTSFMFADFDWLPSPELLRNHDDGDQKLLQRKSEWGEGEPIVTDMKGQDHECYITAPKYCDILFPTDFQKLASFVKALEVDEPKNLMAASVEVQKQSEFLQRYGPKEVKATKSWLTGYTPLLQDFTNCSVLTGRIQQRATIDDDASSRTNSRNRTKHNQRKRIRRTPPMSRKSQSSGTTSDDTCVMF